MNLIEIIKQDATMCSLMLAIVLGLQVVNIVLGAITGTVEEGFDWKKLLFGILKAIIAGCCVVVTVILTDCFGQLINLMPYIQIEAEIITAAQIIAVVVVWAIDSFKCVMEKIKSLKELKFVTYEDVTVIPSDRAQEENDIVGRG